MVKATGRERCERQFKNKNSRGNINLDPQRVQCVVNPQQVTGQLVRPSQRIAGLRSRQQALVQPVLVVEETLGTPPATRIQANAACVFFRDLCQRMWVNLVKSYCIQK